MFGKYQKVFYICGSVSKCVFNNDEMNENDIYSPKEVAIANIYRNAIQRNKHKSKLKINNLINPNKKI